MLLLLQETLHYIESNQKFLEQLKVVTEVSYEKYIDMQHKLSQEIMNLLREIHYKKMYGDSPMYYNMNNSSENTSDYDSHESINTKMNVPCDGYIQSHHIAHDSPKDELKMVQEDSEINTQDILQPTDEEDLNDFDRNIFNKFLPEEVSPEKTKIKKENIFECVSQGETFSPSLNLEQSNIEKEKCLGIAGKKECEKRNATNQLSKQNGKPYQCKICQKRFAFVSFLVKHRSIHADEKPFKCDICGKGFSQPASVKRHLRVHTGEKPYECDFCGKKFSQSGNLHNHVLVCHWT